jgi:hypothetical protein
MIRAVLARAMRLCPIYRTQVPSRVGSPTLGLFPQHAYNEKDSFGTDNASTCVLTISLPLLT